MKGISIKCNYDEYEIIMPSGAKIKIKEDGCEVISALGGERTLFDSKGTFRNNLYTDFGCLKYFEKMGKRERKEVKQWLNSYKAQNEQEETFLSMVNQATKEVQYGYHIARAEAIFDGEQICFKENSQSSVELSDEEWQKKAEEFAPQYKSKLANLHELCYWYAYKIATGECNFDGVYHVLLREHILVLREV